MGSRSTLLRILFVVALIGTPASAYAVSAKITVLVPGSEGSVRTACIPADCVSDGGNPIDLSSFNLSSGEVPDPTANGRIGDPPCIASGFSAGPCFLILPGALATFLVDANGVGQLVLQSFFAINIGGVVATLRVDYQHFNLATNPARPQCTGVSVDGFFSTPTFAAAVGDSIFSSMSVQYTSEGVPQTPLPVDGSNPGNCAVPGLSGKAPLVYKVPQTFDASFNFYNPQNPQQAIQQIPTCPGCDLGATIIKRSETVLAPGDTNNFLGSDLGVIIKVGEEGEPTPADFALAREAIAALFATKEAKFAFKPGNSLNFANTNKNGRVLGDLLGGPNFHVTDVNRTAAGLPNCALRAELRPPGAPAVHAVFGDFNKDGFLDIRMEFSNPALGLKVADKFVTLECHATIGGSSESITAGDVIKVQPKK